MRIRTKRAALGCGSCLFACLVICAFLILSRPEETPLTLRGEVDAVSLYAHNVWFPGGEFQKKEVTGQADVDAIVSELTSIRCRNGQYPPRRPGGRMVAGDRAALSQRGERGVPIPYGRRHHYHLSLSWQRHVCSLARWADPVGPGRRPCGSHQWGSVSEPALLTYLLQKI